MLFCHSKRIFSIDLVARAAVSCEMANLITRITLLSCGPVLGSSFLTFSGTGAATCSSVEFYKVTIRLFSMLRGLDVYWSVLGSRACLPSTSKTTLNGSIPESIIDSDRPCLEIVKTVDLVSLAYNFVFHRVFQLCSVYFY